MGSLKEVNSVERVDGGEGLDTCLEMLTALRSCNYPLQLELGRLDTPGCLAALCGLEAKRDTGMVPNALTWHITR